MSYKGPTLIGGFNSFRNIGHLGSSCQVRLRITCQTTCTSLDCTLGETIQAETSNQPLYRNIACPAAEPKQKGHGAGGMMEYSGPVRCW
jgi:hypothetical protein